MATSTHTLESGDLNSIASCSPSNAAWKAAFAIYEPIGEQWEGEYDRAEEMPESPEKDEAFRVFYKEHLPEYQRARDELMGVPAPTIATLALKMKIADATSDEHHDACLADIQRLARNQER